MYFAFTLTPPELERARAIFARRVQSRFKRLQPWLSVSFTLLTAVLLFGSGFGFFRHPHRPPNSLDIFFSVIWLALALLFWLRRDRIAFEPDYRQEQRFEFSADGLVWATGGGEQARTRWTKIGRDLETDEFFLLSSPWPIEQKPSVMVKPKPVLYIIPKRALDSGTAAQFRELLQQKLSVWAKNPDLKKDQILIR